MMQQTTARPRSGRLTQRDVDTLYQKHEKAERAQLMRERGISELDAAIQMAKLIDQKRGLVISR